MKLYKITATDYPKWYCQNNNYLINYFEIYAENEKAAKQEFKRFFKEYRILKIQEKD